ncbi:MAG: hypothetical protein IPM48_09630 [Saprospiraceae bacterium]|nr:hypothetical protein [Saprospiraceae bacterium]
MIQIPEGFENLLKEAIGEELDSLLIALQEKPPVSIRIHPLKPGHDFDLIGKIPWSSNGFYLKERISFTKDPYFHGGHYYVQEASSMFLDQIFQKIPIPSLPKILDLCAAPGGKSTLLCDFFGREAFIHCHEFISARAEILRQNMLKWAYPNTVVTAGNADKLLQTGIQYDLILVDAPCSGEGMFRKEPEALRQWSLQKVHRCHSIQKNLLQTAYKLLAPGGIIIYSTCTYNTIENEGSIRSSIDSSQFDLLPIDFGKDSPIFQSDHQGILINRCLPSRMSGEGFSFCVLQKKSETKERTAKNNRYKTALEMNIPPLVKHHLHHPDAFRYFQNSSGWYALPVGIFSWFENIYHNKIPLIHAGIPIGEFKGKDWIPHQALALSIDHKPSTEPVTLDLNQALDYLRGLIPKDLKIPNFLHEKWQTVAFKDVTLGWIKCNAQSIKNHYPREFRIRHL